MLGTILGALPVVLPAAISVIKSVERLFGKNEGEKKKSIVVGILLALIPAVENISGRDLVDDELFAEGVGDLVDGIVAVLKATGHLSDSSEGEA